MTDEQTAKIKKRLSWRMWVLLPIILILLVLKAYSVWYWPTAMVRVGDHSMRMIVSDTFAHNIKGLSGRKNLGEFDGMVFYFGERSQHTMVMRDMLFPLDIVWVDRGVVVDMAQHLAPESGRPEAELTPYFARLPSTMVLELPAGKVSDYGIKIGDEVVISR